MVSKSEYYAEIHRLDLMLCVVGGMYHGEAQAISDSDPDFISWKSEKTIRESWEESDRELTPRMIEDGMRVAIGQTTFEELKENNGGKDVPVKIWLDDRATKQGRSFQGCGPL